MRLKSSVKRWMRMAIAKEEFREREPLRFLPDRRLAASALGSLVLLLATFGAGPGLGQAGQDPLASLVEPNARLTIHYIKTVDTELITKGGKDGISAVKKIDRVLTEADGKVLLHLPKRPPMWSDYFRARGRAASPSRCGSTRT